MGTIGFRNIILIASSLTYYTANAQLSSAKVGAYYFDGWTGAYSYHITPSLKNQFGSRMPIWGWITSRQYVMDQQIQLAKTAGLSFFCFCWYYNKQLKTSDIPLNNALALYKKSLVREKVQYALLVVNHQGFEIGPEKWDDLVKIWIDNFGNSEYFKIGNKPLIVFYSLHSLLEEFKGADNVRIALNKFRYEARMKGFTNISLAISIMPDSESIESAKKCGFDILTGYNYHMAGFTENKQKIDIDSLQIAEIKYWNKFRSAKVPYIPVVTLNWDPRPWSTFKNNYNTKPYYIGFSPLSAAKSVRNGLSWINKNQSDSTSDKVLLIYAWNEYGEGAYLTPSVKFKNRILERLKSELNNEK